jgi:cation-transporting ATPase F
LEKDLSQAEVARRQQQYGPNELKAKAATPTWLKFLQQFNQSLLYILLVAGQSRRSWDPGATPS